MESSDYGRFVVPFYWEMYNVNAADCGEHLVPFFGRAAVEVELDLTVEMILSPDWRPTYLGPWYSLAHPRHPKVIGALIAALHPDRDFNENPPAVTALVAHIGTSALPVLWQYSRAKHCITAAVAIAFLSGKRVEPDWWPSEEQWSTFVRLLDVARRIEAHVRAAREESGL